MADYGYGNCPKCVGTFKLTKAGVMRHHLGDVYDGRWRQMCSGVGQPPKAGAKPISNAPDLTDLPVPKAEAKPSTKDLPPDVYIAAATASVRTEGVNDGYIEGTAAAPEFRAAVEVAFAAGRAQAAADIRADRGSLDGLTWQERAAQLAEAGPPNALKLQSDGPLLQETPEG